MNYEDQVTKQYIEDAIAGAGAKIATGGYTGDGKYHRSDPAVLSFDFAPKMVIIACSGSQLYTDGICVLIRNHATATYICINSSSAISLLFRKVGMDWNGTQLCLYDPADTNSHNALNAEGVDYQYCAIG